jgi:hypothetical protein
VTDADTAAAATAVPEFRPSWAAFHRRLLARMLLVGPLLVIVLIVATWPSVGLAVMMVGATLALGGLALAVYFGRTSARIEGSTIRVRGPFRTRRWSFADIADLVLVPQPGTPPSPPGRERPTPATLYAVSHLHERLFWLSGDFWERPVLDEVAAAIGAPLHEVPRGLPAQEVQQRYPGTVGWTVVRPWLFALLVAVGAALLMLVVSIVAAVVLIATGQVQLPAGV